MHLRTALIALSFLTLPVSQAWAAGGASSEPAAGGGSMQLAMSLYAAGLGLGHVDMDARFTGDKYRVTSNLETSGVVNVFWKSQIQATSSGKLDKKSMQVASYDSFYTGHKANHQEVALTYENGEPVRLYANPTYPTTGYEVKPEEKKGTFDPLSAVIYIASGVGAEPGNPCSVKAPVYDGRRRYNVALTKVKPVDIKMDNGLYKGPALLCTIEYKQISGYKPRVLHDTNFPSINVWMGVFPSKETGRSFAVPLRVWANTQYGVIAAVATSLKIDGKPVQ
ncbi:DUF3108 domain-containing protein [Rhizomicrobium electricum]|uniref:DUF3108 domain-containing protein n=1 Tax=Rhizomicrobium electricum TaxID=480070 RepID=A0ABP3Q4P4_9PROT|nr:DUF3108 domain-containing protein [Rhizomicrobium electricum]NIJ50091.1 hypothetical protein [Rhizomicrobium electricum]